MLNGLDLFSGIGGPELALAKWVRTIAYCESYEPSQNILLELQQKGEIPVAPIWDDLRTLDRRHIRVPVDIITAGWPCQDLSSAGTRKGLGGERSSLIFEVFRLVREFMPQYLFLENSPNITVSGLSKLLLELDAMGYDARWTVVSAAEMGAPHLRERFWLLAHAHGHAHGHALRLKSKSEQRSGDPTITQYACKESAADSSGLRWRTWGTDRKQSRGTETHGARNKTFDALRAGRQRWIDAEAAWKALTLGSGSGSGSGGASWPSWLPEPCIGRGHHGISGRVDKLQGLGNAWVPQVAEEAFWRLSGL